MTTVLASQRRDPMRLFAWCCVVAGVLIALGALAYVPYRDAAIRREITSLGPLVTLPASIEAYRAEKLYAEQLGLSHWPGVITGAAVTAFGVLLRAIRRPKAGES